MLFLLITLLLSEASAKRCLIVSVDNRDLETSITANQYASMTAVVNLQYAKRHGYDYIYVQNVISNFENEVRSKYPEAQAIPPTDNAKDAATAYHVGLKQFRAASWAKLPALWHIAVTRGQDYDYIWYIDSDAAVSPLQGDRGIEEVLEKAERGKELIRGNEKISESAFVFFHNHPWRDDMPCAGSFIFQPKKAEPILREWWDYNLPSKNFKHFHEQDALWHMIQAETDDNWKMSHPDVHFQMNSQSYTILKERQFPSAYQRYEDLWLCHIASYNYLARMPILYHFLYVLDLLNNRKFQQAVEEINERHTVKIKVLHVCESMEKASAEPNHFEPKPSNVETNIPPDPNNPFITSVEQVQNPVENPNLPFAFAQGKRIKLDGIVINPVAVQSTEVRTQVGSVNRISEFPVHDEASQSAWYDAHVTSKNEPTLPYAKLYEGRLIRRRGEFWIVSNGKKRGFDGYDTFLRLGLLNEMAFLIGDEEANAIPPGPTIVQSEVSKGLSGINPLFTQIKINTKTKNPSAGLETENSVFSPLKLKKAQMRKSRFRNKEFMQNYTRSHPHCQFNSELEKLVFSNGTRSILYLISHDNTSEHLSKKFSDCREHWIQPVRITSTVFFESIVYREVFPAFMLEWESLDYVITATYKTVAKQLHYNGFTQSLEQIQRFLNIAREGDYDIVPFLRSGSGTMSFCTYFHGKNFQKAWDALLQELGFSLPLIRSLDETKAFYRNIFIIKTSVLKELMEFMNNAMEIALSVPHVRELLQVDSGYKEGSEEVSLRIFGTKYYQMFPFVFERLPSFFLHAKNAKICAAPDGPCKYNS